MELKIISDIENPLFNRKAIEGEIYSDSTPSREEVLKLLAEKFSVPQEVIKIRTIKGKFGQKVFLIVANIYKSKEDKEKIEHSKKKDIELEKKLATPKEKPAEAIEEVEEEKEESPEEKKQEVKVEEKKEEAVEEKPEKEKKEESKVEDKKEEKK